MICLIAMIQNHRPFVKGNGAELAAEGGGKSFVA